MGQHLAAVKQAFSRRAGHVLWIALAVAVVLLSSTWNPDMARVLWRGVWTPLQSSLTSPTKRQARREALNRIAIPLTTVNPAVQSPPSLWLSDLAKGSRVIGVGEGSHGTAEHFQFKHRLFRELVEHHGFTLLGIEAPFNDAYLADQYVQGLAPNDPVAATLAFGDWPWQTQELRRLLEWMRQYNATREGKSKVRVVGFDLQDPVMDAAVQRHPGREVQGARGGF